MGSFSLLRQYGSKCQFEFGSSSSQFKPANKNSNSRGFLQSAQPYGSKFQFENGASAPEFEPFAKTKAINLGNEKSEAEIDKFNSEDVVIDIKIVDVKTRQTENKNIRTLINETENEKINSNTIATKTTNERLKPEGREELNIEIKNKSKTKNEQIAKTKTKATPSTIQKFSNHIKFIDYIPTHEIITYRHLFAYGFYVE